VGRKQILTAPAVKVLAEKNGLKVWQPEKLDEEFYEEITKEITPIGEVYKPHPDPLLGKERGVTGAELFIVAAYGKIIPQKFLDLPKFGCLNVHPSLLPKYRGASPIQSALLHGEKETGVTIMKMDAEMDHGPIISNFEFRISNFETQQTLSEKLAEVGAELLLKSVPDYLTGKIEPKEQNHNAATFCKIIKKSDGEINWQKSAEQIYNQWRAFWPWPGIFFELRINLPAGKAGNYELRIKIIELSLNSGEDSKHKPGELFAENNKLFVAGGDQKLLEIKKLQPEGKNIMNDKDFINGYLK
jgi:methionyl-tRNA formyltransferase